jgi:hypothetical protein
MNSEKPQENKDRRRRSSTTCPNMPARHNETRNIVFHTERFPSDRISMNRAVEAVAPEGLAQSKRTPARPNNTRLFASWQSGPETLSGLSQSKLRLELAASGCAQITKGKLRGQTVIAHRV